MGKKKAANTKMGLGVNSQNIKDVSIASDVLMGQKPVVLHLCNTTP